MLFVIKVKKNITKIMKNIIKTLDIYNEIHYNIITNKQIITKIITNCERK